MVSPLADELRPAVSASRPRPLVHSAAMAPDELIGFRELVDLLGVSRASAARYSRRADFPAPVERLAGGRVWRRADVEAWAKANLPLRTGRPPRKR